MPKVAKSGLFLINIFRYKINFQLPSLGVLVPILVLCKSMESRYLFRSRFSVLNVILLFHKIFSEQPIFKLCSKYDKPKITNNLLILQKF